MIMKWFGVTHKIISYNFIKRKNVLFLNKTKVIAVEMYYCCKEGLAISVTILVFELVIWMVVKELLHFCMTGVNELIICVLQSLV